VFSENETAVGEGEVFFAAGYVLSCNIVGDFGWIWVVAEIVSMESKMGGFMGDLHVTTLAHVLFAALAFNCFWYSSSSAWKINVFKSRRWWEDPLVFLIDSVAETAVFYSIVVVNILLANNAVTISERKR